MRREDPLVNCNLRSFPFIESEVSQLINDLAVYSLVNGIFANLHIPNLHPKFQLPGFNCKSPVLSTELRSNISFESGNEKAAMSRRVKRKARRMGEERRMRRETEANTRSPDVTVPANVRTTPDWHWH